MTREEIVAAAEDVLARNRAAAEKLTDYGFRPVLTAVAEAPEGGPNITFSITAMWHTKKD